MLRVRLRSSTLQGKEGVAEEGQDHKIFQD